MTPTSRFCIQRVCRPIDLEKDQLIVEYGAGAGVFAKYLLPRMTPDSRLVLFETNELLFEKLKKMDDPRLLLYNESVEHVLQLLPEEFIGKTDYIISGIPFSFLDEQTRKSVLEQSVELLREGGKFLAYQTSGHLKEPLVKAFGNSKTGWEWRNIPPMTIYEARK